MARNRVVIKDNFAVARKYGDEAVQKVVRDATDVMFDTAKTKVARGEDQRGYALNTLFAALEKQYRDKAGVIKAPVFYARFFEYGTLYIKAMPFMRPAARAGGNYVKQELGKEFVRKMRRAEVRR